MLVPTRPSDGSRIAHPIELFESVRGAWDGVVATQQAGLMDAKTPHLGDAPLRAEEAWHHYRAGQQGVVDAARFLITFTLVPSVQSGGSALHLAAATGAEARLRELLRESPALDIVDARNGYGHTPLTHAVATGQAGAVRALLAAGADPEHRGFDGCTPLMIAAAFGHAAVARALIDVGHADAAATHAFAGSTALHFAAEMGSADVAVLLCGVEPRAAFARTRAGGQPLHTAADCNQSHLIGPLTAPREKGGCGADVNSLLAGDTTPVYLAAQRGFSAVVAALAAAGADLDFAMPAAPFAGALVDPQASPDRVSYAPVNTVVGNGATALHAAVENGHLACALALLRLGARQTTAMQGASPLLIALQYRHPDIALALLAAGGRDGAHVDAQTPHDGETPLHVAARAGYTAVAAALLDAGARSDLRSRGGGTALDVARRARRTDIVDLILRHSSAI